MSLLWIAHRRLWGRPWLAVMSIVGIALAVGLAVSVPIFAQAVSRGIMEDELAALAQQTGRSALAIRIYLLPVSARPVTAQQAQDLSGQIAGIFEQELGIPVRSCQLTIESMGLMLKSARDGAYGPAGTFLGNAKVGFLTGIEEHVERVSGEPLGTRSSTDAANAWMHEAWAAEMGVEDGEEFIIQPIVQGAPVKVRIAGTWRPRDIEDPFWPSSPDAVWRSVLLFQPDDYAAMVEPALGGAAVGSLSWAVNLDESRFVPELAERYVKGFKRSLVRLQQLLPDARCDVSPLPVLEAYLGRRHSLTILLFAFSVPIVGFLLYSLTLVSNVLVDGQRPVTAIMASRGMTPGQLLRISLFEGLFLLAIGTPLGVLVGLGAARLMGHSASFMRFVARSPLTVTLAGIKAWLILLTMAVALLARLWPAIRESGRSVIEYLQHASRPTEKPAWQRFYLDFILIIPTVYAYRQLKQQGSIIILGWRSSGDIFRDPALFLVPALFMLTASLLCARLFPLVMRLLDRFVSGHLSLSWCVTLRQLGRQGEQYVNSLLLIMVALSVGAFMASMALSLDRWLEDRLHYRLGADVVLRIESAPSDSGEGPMAAPEAGGVIAESAMFIPLQNVLAIPGVEAATNVGSYRAQIPVTLNQVSDGRFLGVDRVTFASAAAFRPDFAKESLGELLNRLALQEDGVLVSRQLLEGSARSIGDPLQLRITPDGTNYIDVRTVIVGTFDYFPTVYEEERPTVVGNLDYLTTVAGGVSTYELWLKIDPARTTPKELERQIGRIAGYYSRYQDVRTLLKEEYEKKERIGVYGTLSIGFLACLGLAGTGLLIQYHKSLQERLFRFATLRAIGLSQRQLVAQVQLEYLIVLVTGIAAGVLIGEWASRLFIPFFRVSGAEGQLPLPPLLTLLDQRSIAAMAGAFAVLQIAAQSGLIHRAMRSELFQVLRMGMQE